MFFLHFSRLDRFTRIASLIKRDKNSYRINRQRFLRYARSVKRLNVKLNFSMRRFHDYSPEITRKGKENRKRETFLPVLSSIQDFNWEGEGKNFQSSISQANLKMVDRGAEEKFSNSCRAHPTIWNAASNRFSRDIPRVSRGWLTKKREITRLSDEPTHNAGHLSHPHTQVHVAPLTSTHTEARRELACWFPHA